MDDDLYEAVDLYCITPGCTCGEVFVGVEAHEGHEGHDKHSIGHVVVEPSGALRMEPKRGAGGRIERVWAAFQKRHPRYQERFARRGAVLKELGSRVMPLQAVAAKAQPKVGRNDPCPCGSGKKYKKCCESAALAQSAEPARAAKLGGAEHVLVTPPRSGCAREKPLLPRKLAHD